MSEIFSWFKRTEQQKRSVPAQVHSRPLATLSADAVGNGTDSPVAVADPSPAAPVKIEIRGADQFNLDLADYRVKSVLDPATVVGEQFRVLRAQLSFAQKQRNIKTLLVTSSAPGEGKTFTSCSLAGVLAQEPGKRVLLIDADMRKAKAGRDLGLIGAEVKGLAEVLRGEVAVTDVLLSSKDTPLFLLPAGNVPINPSELLSSPDLERSLKTVAQWFDWVIIDSPPVVALADTNVIAPICDAVLLVVHTNGTPTKLIQESIQRIGRDKICGIVMNRIRHSPSSRYYYRYYHQSPASR